MKKEPTKRWALAKELAKEFHVAPETALQWFDAGCPMTTFDEAAEWKRQKVAESSIMSQTAGTLNRYDKARKEASSCEETAKWSEMSDDFRHMCDVVADLHIDGISISRIHKILGLSTPVINRIIENHPLTKDKDQDYATRGWQRIRRLAISAMTDKLQDPEELKKLKAFDLNMFAGTADDKLSKQEMQQISVSIEQKVMHLSVEELLASIPKAETIEGEFTPLPAPETSSGIQTASAKAGDLGGLSLNNTGENDEETNDNV